MTGDPQNMDINALPSPWTKKQYLFALHYLGEAKQNATEAARMAGYSKNTARTQGPRLLSDVAFKHIQSYIAERARKSVEKHEITAERTLNEMARVAYSNILDYLVVDQSNGLPYVDMRKVTREQAAAISKIKIKELPPFKTVENGEEVAREVISVELSLWDKNKAAEALGRYQKLEKALDVNVNHTGHVKLETPELARKMAFLLRKGAEDGKKGGERRTKESGTDGQTV